MLMFPEWRGLRIDGLTPVIINVALINDPMALVSWSD